MSAKDKRIVEGIAHCLEGCLKDINQLLGLKTGEINQYRKHLNRKGIVNGEEYGHLRFTLPMFREYVIEQGSFSK